MGAASGRMSDAAIASRGRASCFGESGGGGGGALLGRGRDVESALGGMEWPGWCLVLRLQS